MTDPNHPNPKPKQNQDIPRDLNVPVHRHSSETKRSPVDAGGQVPRPFYEGTAPKLPG